MSTPALSVDEFCGVREVASLLATHGFNGVPVLARTGRLIGIVTEDDIVLRQDPKVMASSPHRWSDPHKAERARAHGRLAREIMTPNPLTIAPSAHVSEAAELMHEHHVKSLPVVDVEGQLVGMLARRDLVRLYTRADKDLRDELQRRFLDWGFDPTNVSLQVKDGVATITGSVERTSDASLLGRLAETVGGLAGIRV